MITSKREMRTVPLLYVGSNTLHIAKFALYGLLCWFLYYNGFPLWISDDTLHGDISGVR